jgi:hypothetical protein
LILAIDPGNVQSAIVMVSNDLSKIHLKMKEENQKILNLITEIPFSWLEATPVLVAIEMIGHYGAGMPAGKTVFDTCIWIGRFVQVFSENGYDVTYIMRRDEKMALCGTMKAKDGNIIQSLIDRFAPDTPNKGKGTKKEPGFFYGFKADIWQAFAVACTYHDMYLVGGESNAEKRTSLDVT